MNSVGAPYDFGGLFGSVWVLIGKWFHRKFHNPLQNSDALFCSELAVKVLQGAKFPGSDLLVAYDTSPQDLRDFLEAYVAQCK
jgi:hypothetical protein